MLAEFNASEGEFQCPVSAARKAECIDGVCAKCFGDVPSSRLKGDPFKQATLYGNQINPCEGDGGSQRRRTYHEMHHYPGTPLRYDDPFPPNPPRSPDPPHAPPLPPPYPRPPLPPNVPGVDPNEAVRNPCLDYVAISQLCIGRDEQKKEKLATVCPRFTTLSDVEKTKGLEGNGCTLQGTSLSNLRTGGYADESSLCGLLGDDLFNQLSTFDDCKRCYLPMRQMANSSDSFTLPPGATETTNCVDYCTAVLTQDLLGSRIAPGFVPDLCAGQDVLGQLTSMISLVDIFRAFEVAAGVTILLSTIVTLSPAALSLVLGIIKAGKVLKASLPWVRLPSFQILLATAVVLPLVIAIMASFFQVAADGWSLALSLSVVASFLSNWPTHYFVQAKSYNENSSEMRRRGHIQSAFLLLALTFLGLWLGLSSRLRQVLHESGFVDLRKLGEYRTPRAPMWILITVVLDFLGKSVLSKIFFTDLLLLVTARTELAESSSAQRVMRDQAAVLYSFADETHEAEARLRRGSVAAAKGSVAGVKGSISCIAEPCAATPGAIRAPRDVPTTAAVRTLAEPSQGKATGPPTVDPRQPPEAHKSKPNIARCSRAVPTLEPPILEISSSHEGCDSDASLSMVADEPAERQTSQLALTIDGLECEILGRPSHAAPPPPPS